MHTTSEGAGKLGDIGDLNFFIRFLSNAADLTGKRLAETITTVLMERGRPLCQSARISRNEKHEHEY